MKKLVFYLLGLMLLMATACSNEWVDMNSSKSQIEIRSLIIEPVVLEDSILSFIDSNILENILQNVEKTIDVFREKGFQSMYDLFDDAMENADYYYDTKEHYELFKEIYSSLYFPECEDDYSAYLPISNQNLAKLANKNGFIKVNGILVDCKDISNYEQLDSLGLTPPNEKLRSKEVFSYRVNKNKLWVKYSTVNDIRKIEGAKFEICFRKKGFAGIWYNRKASTTISCANCDLSYASDPLSAVNVGIYAKRYKNDAFSSHDYEFYPYHLQGGGNKGYSVIVTFGPFGDLQLNFTVKKDKKEVI